MRPRSQAWRRILTITVGLALCVVIFSLAPSRAHAAPPRGTPTTYVVQSGDTLYAIALRYDTTVALLKQWNVLKSDNIIVGQKLVVSSGSDAPVAPALPATASYIVQPGDTLYRIALRFGTSTRALADLNGIPNPNLITVGQALAIPNSIILAKPGLSIDPATARQGGTLLVKVSQPDLDSVKGTINGLSIPFTRSAGYFYALIGTSRCAKLGETTLTLSETDTNGNAISESAPISVVATAFSVQNVNLPPGKGELLEPTLINRENEQFNALVAPFTPARLWSGAFRQPVTGPVSAQFGHRRSYNGGPVGACGHEGIDYAVNGGTPILSDARGRVVFAGLTQVRGNLVVVDHGLGVYSAYFHQSAMAVSAGQMVEAGDLIGQVGTTGLSTGNHLHWSVFVNGVYVDPTEWTRRVFP